MPIWAWPYRTAAARACPMVVLAIAPAGPPHAGKGNPQADQEGRDPDHGHQDGRPGRTRRGGVGRRGRGSTESKCGCVHA
jgi:hypothetical protein